MNNIKALVRSSPLIFSLIILAFILDLSGLGAQIAPGSIFLLPSIVVAIYLLGISALIRFVIARRSVHVAITWVVLIFLYFGWFIVWALITDGEPYTPSLLFLACLIASFKTLRFSEQTTKPDVANENGEAEAET